MCKHLSTHGAFALVIYLSYSTYCWPIDFHQESQSVQETIHQVNVKSLGGSPISTSQNAQNTANHISATTEAVDRADQSIFGSQSIQNQIVASTLSTLVAMSQTGTNTGNLLRVDHVKNSEQSFHSNNTSLPAQAITNELKATNVTGPNRLTQDATAIGNTLYAGTATEAGQSFKGDQIILNRFAAPTPASQTKISQTALAIANLIQVEDATDIEQRARGHQTLINIAGAQDNAHSNAIQQSQSYANLVIIDGRNTQEDSTNVTITQSSSMSQHSRQNSGNLSQTGNSAVVYR